MLTIDHLEKCFGSTVLFRDLTFTVDGPAVLWAPSGWGKTTLLRILMGLETPTAGRVQGAGRVSAVFQEDRLCPQLTAVQNVLLVLPDDRQEAAIRQDFARLGLDEAALALPARKLSGGQKRRTALLRALWAPGDTLLLDEPFTGMDPAAAGAGGGPSGAAGHPRPCRHRRTGLADAGAAEAGTAGCGLQFHKQRITIRVSSAKRLHVKNPEPETEVFQLWLVLPFWSAKRRLTTALP